PGTGVLEDVGDLLRLQPRVDRDQHGAGRRHAEVRVEQRRHVRGEEGDAVAATDPVLLEGAREPPCPLRELGPVQSHVTVHDRGTLGEDARTALQEGEWAETAQMNGQGGGTVRRMAVSETGFSAVRLREEGPAAWITLDRPEKRNALSLELMQELIEAL